MDKVNKLNNKEDSLDEDVTPDSSYPKTDISSALFAIALAIARDNVYTTRAPLIDPVSISSNLGLYLIDEGLYKKRSDLGLTLMEDITVRGKNFYICLKNN